MKVKELINELEKRDPNLNVYISGYEGGYNDVEGLSVERMVRNYHNEETWWYGSHELVEVVDSYQIEKSEDGIIIG
mgnify:CR=1 FL=1